MIGLGIIYLLNSAVLVSGFIYSMKRKRACSIFFLSLLAFHFASIIDFTQLKDDHSIQTLVYGQELMLLANSILSMMVISLDYLVIQQRWNTHKKTPETS